LKSFQDKVVVITGAGSGIGRALAVAFNQSGSHLALCDLAQGGLEETQDLLENKNLQASLHIVDVSDREQMGLFADEVIAQHGQADILINNAGITLTPTPFDEIPNKQFEKIINVNMWGVYNGVRAFIPHLKIRPEASIVTISSLAGLIGLTGYSPYAMSKFAVRALSEALSMELSATPVHVMVVHPGGVKTNLIRNAPDLAEDQREGAHQIFLKAAFLTPDKTAGKILRGILKKRNRIILGVDAKIVYTISRVFPRRYPKILQAFFSQMTFK